MSKEATVEATHSVPLVDVLSMGTRLQVPIDGNCDPYHIETSGLVDAHIRHFHSFSIALQDIMRLKTG